MRLWRIVKKQHIDSAFTGVGARLYGGRWNHIGTSIVYTSDSLALAAMELFIHVQRADKKRPVKSVKLFSIEIKVPKGIPITEIEFEEIPETWKNIPASDESKDVGTNWAREGKSLLLKVPTVVVPAGFNYLINPLHKDFIKLDISEPKEFIFDRRLWRE
jgi:RES domain-containing protein